MNNSKDSFVAKDASQPGTLQVIGEFDQTQPVTELQLEDGRLLRIPTHLLLPTTEGAGVGEVLTRSGDAVVPVVEEHLTVGKRTIETGRVRIQKTTEESTEPVEQVLRSTTFEVEKVTLNQPVDAAPPVRTEGETIIYPVCEEQLVTSKRLVLKEEIRVTRRETERTEAQTVTLRRERVSVERTGNDANLVLPS